MVMNPKAESTDFATLKVSWELPHIERSDRPEAQIGHYRQDEKMLMLKLFAHFA